jgi:hypothetical protein
MGGIQYIDVHRDVNRQVADPLRDALGRGPLGRVLWVFSPALPDTGIDVTRPAGGWA